MDGFTAVSIDDVVDVWVLADMYQMEGLKWCCMGSLERDLCKKNDASRILKEAEELSCPIDELKRICLKVLHRNEGSDYLYSEDSYNSDEDVDY